MPSIIGLVSLGLVVKISPNLFNGAFRMERSYPLPSIQGSPSRIVRFMIEKVQEVTIHSAPSQNYRLISKRVNLALSKLGPVPGDRLPLRWSHGIRVSLAVVPWVLNLTHTRAPRHCCSIAGQGVKRDDGQRPKPSSPDRARGRRSHMLLEEGA